MESATTLIPRDAELAMLRSAVERAAAGRAATVLVAGDAGVGKTRLLGELATEARPRGVLVLVGHCVELAEGELPYVPIAGALRALVSQLEPEDLDEVLGPARGELAQLLPDLGAGDRSSRADGTFGKARLFELLLGALGRLAERQPVLLAIEDLHWADGSTRDLLRFLVRSATGERLAIVATYRADDLHRVHPLRPFVAELARDPRVSHLTLRPFSRAAFDDHVAAILGELPSPAVRNRLFERSEGNAFFTEELLAAAEPGGTLPDSLRDAMLVRLERLSPPTQVVMRVVAAAGRRVDYELVAAAAGRPEAQLTEALREAVAHQVLVPAADGAAYEFRHALLREVAYGEVLPGEREALHADLARALEARGGADAAELAVHWHAAGELERALTASIEAGERAADVYAYPEALRHFQRALELWERAGPGGVDLSRLTEEAAEAANAAGEQEIAITLARRAVELADSPLAAALAHTRLARCLWDAGRGEEAVAASARASSSIPTEPTLERALVLEAHARHLLLAGRLEEGIGPVDEAIEIAQALGRRDVEAAALATRIIAMHGRAEEAVAAGREALSAARDAGVPETLMRAYINASQALDQAGQVQAAIDLNLEGADVARRLGAERAMGTHMKGEVAGRLVMLARFEEAAAVIEDARRAGPTGTSAVSLHHAAATIAAHRGDASGVHAAVALAEASALEAGSGQSSARGAAAAAELALWQGDADAACAIVERALELVEGAEFFWYSASLYALGAWAYADRALRTRAAGAQAIEALVTRFDGLLVGTPPPEPAAYRSQLAAELGRLADPPHAAPWEATAARWDALGYRFHAALCRWRQAEALLVGEGDRAVAAQALADAGRVARDIGAAPLVAEIEGLARRARIRLEEAAVQADDPAVAAGLSPREAEVLELLAEGHTNREIGSALFISEKTVSVHVSRILAKLGAANRAQAATVAHRLGLTRS